MADRSIPAVIARLRFGDSDGEDHDIAANEIDRLVLERQQAQLERDCVVERLAEVRKLLSDCADPVACQLAEARRNLDLYKGYSSRERRYSYEIAELERLQTAIRALDVPAEGK